MFFCEFYKHFKNTFFREHLQVAVSDINMQVAVIFKLNLSLQFVTINVYIFPSVSFHTDGCFNVG